MKNNDCYPFEGGIREESFEDRMGYSPQIADELLERFNKKGWNLYRTGSIKMMTKEGIVHLGLAKGLIRDMPYILLPVADDPTDYKSVMKKMRQFAKKREGKLPTIKILNKEYPLTGIILREDDVKIQPPAKICVSYGLFKNSLESIIETF